MTKIIGATTPTIANNTSLAASVTTATVSTSSLAQFASEDINLATSKEGCLVSFQASRSCLVRVYSTSAARSGDNRAYNVAVPVSGVMGLIAEVEIDTAVANSVVTNIVYANEDSPQSGVLYLKVFNLGAVGAINLSLGISQFQSIVPITNFPQGGFIESPTVKEFPIFVSNASYLVNSLVLKTSAGSCIVSVQIDGVSVIGLNLLTATSTRQVFNATGLNVMGNASRIVLVVSSVTGAVGLEFTLNFAGI